MHNRIQDTIRRVWPQLAVSAGLLAAAVRATAPHAHPVLAATLNHCEPVVRDR
jgi:hypothetical protein